MSIKSIGATLSDLCCDRVVRFAVVGMILAAGMWVAFPYVRYWFALAMSRVFEPYPIGWLEPLFFKSALRVFDGLPIYGPPAIDYIAPIYGPGIGTVGGLLFKAFGPGYSILRIVSVASIGVLAVASGLWIKRTSGSWLYCWIPAVLILMLDRPMNYWFMRVNVDIPYLCLAFTGFFLVYSFGPRRSTAIAAGLAMALASLFKQNALVMAIAVAVYLFLLDKKACLCYIAAMASLLIPVAIVLHFSSHGWFWTITGIIPMESITKRDVRWFASLRSVFLPGLVGFVLSAVLLPIFDEGKRRLFWPLMVAAMIAVSYKTFAKDGGGENCLLPVFVPGIIFPFLLIGLVSRRLLARIPRIESDRIAMAAALLFLLFVTPAGQWKPAERKAVTIPKYADFNSRIRSIVAETEGSIFVGARPDVLYNEGRPQNFHQTTLYEGTFRTSVYDMEKLLDKPLSEHKWNKLVLWDYGEKPFRALVGKYYKKSEELGRDPLIGVKVSIWVPRD